MKKHLPSSSPSDQEMPSPDFGRCPVPRAGGLCEGESRGEGSAFGTSEIHPPITKRDLVPIFKQNKDLGPCCDAIRNLLGDRMKQQLSNEELKVFRGIIAKVKYRFEDYYKGVHRRQDQFETLYSSWLQSSLDLPELLKPSKEIQQQGRPRVDYADASRRTQYRQEQELATQIQDEPMAKVARAIESIAKNQKDPNLSLILKEALKSPNRAFKIRQRLRDKTPFPCSEEEALALILDCNLTRNAYEQIRATALSHNSTLFPAYYKVAKAKENCRPAYLVDISDTSASVPLEHLMHHTASRLLQLQADMLQQYSTARGLTDLKVTLIASWGFDGSTGQSQYKQRFADTEGQQQSDAALFVTTMIPLQIRSENGDPLWHNQAPQSVRWCRPLRIQFLKETNDSILSEKQWVEEQIEHLHPFVSNISGVEITIEFQLWLTVIDGKVLKTITGTSSCQACPVCGAKPKEMNDIDRQPFQPIDDSRLLHGISPLHAWIRCYEFCLHLGYRNVDGLRCWRIPGGENNAIFKARKRQIQDEMIKQLSIRADFPQPGGAGSTNDGNSARTAFSPKHQEAFAKILGLPLKFIEQLHVILCVLSSSLPINSKEFGDYCYAFAFRYVRDYKWFYMPASIHKILMHGAVIIERSILPLGMLSEQAGESRNKNYRGDRERHARKISREMNLLDVFNRALF